MKTLFFFRSVLTLALLSLAGCAPQALYFHESTKVSFSADYTSSDSQPLSTSFGYKRRIVAIVPGKERFSPTGEKRDAENEGEALSTISKFYVKAGTQDGLVIKNNFATGMAARRLMKEPTSAAVAVAGLMHGTTVLTDSAGIVVDTEGNTLVGSSGAPITASDVAASRVARIKSKMIGGGGRGSQPKELEQPAVGVISMENGVTMITVRQADGMVIKIPYRKYLEDKKKSGGGDKPKPDTDQPGTGTPKPDQPLLPEDKVNAAPSAELFKDPVTGKTMKRIAKPDGTTEVVPLR